MIHTRQGQRTKGKDDMDTGTAGCGRRQTTNTPARGAGRNPPRQTRPGPVRVRVRHSDAGAQNPEVVRSSRTALRVPAAARFSPFPFSPAPYCSPSLALPFPECARQREWGPLAPFFLPTSTLPNSTQIPPPLRNPPRPTWTNRPLSRP